MIRKNILSLRKALQPCLLASIGKLLFLLPFGVGLIIGCDLDRDTDAEPPMIEELAIDEQIINIRDVTSVTAKIPRNEDPNLRYEYMWSTTGGQIKHNGVRDTERASATTTDNEVETKRKKEDDNKVEAKRKKEDDSVSSLTALATYIAPETAGTYTITLKVCTRYAVVEKTVKVVVTDHIIELYPYVYWEEKGKDQSLTYQFDVEAIRRSPILLRYKIQQDARQPRATLIIDIDRSKVTQESIPAASLTKDVIISKDVDITSHINRIGQYELRFTLEPKLLANTWLLKNIQIIGVEGHFVPHKPRKK